MPEGLSTCTIYHCKICSSCTLFTNLTIDDSLSRGAPPTTSVEQHLITEHPNELQQQTDQVQPQPDPQLQEAVKAICLHFVRVDNNSNTAPITPSRPSSPSAGCKANTKAGRSPMISSPGKSSGKTEFEILADRDHESQQDRRERIKKHVKAFEVMEQYLTRTERDERQEDEWDDD